jgi:hypothetical protein
VNGVSIVFSCAVGTTDVTGLATSVNAIVQKESKITLITTDIPEGK